MTNIPHTTRQRRLRRQRAGKTNSIRWGFGCSSIISLVSVFAILITAFSYIQISRDLPPLDLLPALLSPESGALLEPTKIFDQTGTHLLYQFDNPVTSERLFLSLDTSQGNFIPQSVISATLATQDPSFWQHGGFHLFQWRDEPHPTLARQLASAFYLWDEPEGIRRSLRETLLAAQLTARYGRAQVLTWYLNSVHYGHYAYGIEAAAQLYFGKPAASLSIAEAAALAATAQALSLNPFDAPRAVVEHSREIIREMAANGFLTLTQAQRAKPEDLTFNHPPPSPPSLRDAFINLVLEEIDESLPSERIARGGYKIITSLDYDTQLQAECAVSTLLSQNIAATEGANPAGESGCRTARLIPSLAPRFALPKDVKANVVILDPQSGEIIAMVGSTIPGEDPAHLPGHSPGTLLTPFIYLAGFTQGLGPASLLWDIPAANFPTHGSADTYHGPVRLRIALANDYLPPAEQVLQQVGPASVWRAARQMGLSTPVLPDEFSIDSLLSGVDATLLEVSHAFSTFANQGSLAGIKTGGDEHPQIEPFTIRQALDETGNPLAIAEPQTQPVITPQLAYLVNHILADEPARWPSLGHPNPLEIGIPVAAKLGSTQTGKDAWALGYTLNYLVGVWIGTQSTSPGSPVPPVQAAALWHALMQDHSMRSTSQTWPTPAGISTVAVCDPSGMLPTEDCPTVVNEIFLNGFEPSQSDTLYKRLFINRETGRLATVFTPPELVESRIYLVVPPEAATWAASTGLPIPPKNYDVIPADTKPSETAHISSPAMFATIRGQVEIGGSAGGVGFRSFRIQAGNGINPQKWLLIGENTQPVINGTLGIWDTQGLDGLYALQLLVVHEDRSVETAITQVTIDNQRPTITILHPQEGDSLPANADTIFEVEAQDNLALVSVIFYLDQRRVAAFNQGPFRYKWEPEPGTHNFTVIAQDKAGNNQSIDLTFSVP